MKISRLCLALLTPAALAAAEKPIAIPTTAASPDAADLLAPLGARPKSATVAAKPATARPASKSADKSEWVFSLLPKSLQKNPRLDLTVITEMTAPGNNSHRFRRTTRRISSPSPPAIANSATHRAPKNRSRPRRSSASSPTRSRRTATSPPLRPSRRPVS